MKLRILSLALCLGFLVSACAPAGPESPTGRADFDAFVEALNQARKNELPWTEEEKSIALPAGLTEADFDSEGNRDLPPSLLTEQEMEQLLQAPGDRQSVTAEQARADVELFFRALKTAYGGYDYFGGDAVFFPARDAVMERLEALDRLTGKRLSEYLRDALESIISDGHFNILNERLVQGQVMYYVPRLFLSPAETDAPDLLKRTIGPSGELIWFFAVLSPDGANLPREAVVRGERTSLDWTRADNYAADSRPAYKRLKRGGVPVLVCRTLFAEDRTRAKLQALAAGGVDWRDEPLFMLDVRDHQGGNEGYAHDWIKGFAGVRSEPKVLGCSRYSSLFVRQFMSTAREPMGEMSALEGKYSFQPQCGALLATDSLIFVLQDRGTASAGEGFTYYMRGLENVVCVGSNTAGMTMIGNVIDLRLPNSGVTARFGGNLTFYGTTENIEGRGHLPDLWVPPQEAEDAVLRLIRYYSLK